MHEPLRTLVHGISLTPFLRSFSRQLAGYDVNTLFALSAAQRSTPRFTTSGSGLAWQWSSWSTVASNRHACIVPLPTRHQHFSVEHGAVTRAAYGDVHIHFSQSVAVGEHALLFAIKRPSISPTSSSSFSFSLSPPLRIICCVMHGTVSELGRDLESGSVAVQKIKSRLSCVLVCLCWSHSLELWVACILPFMDSSRSESVKFFDFLRQVVAMKWSRWIWEGLGSHPCTWVTLDVERPLVILGMTFFTVLFDKWRSRCVAVFLRIQQRLREVVVAWLRVGSHGQRESLRAIKRDHLLVPGECWRVRLHSVSREENGGECRGAGHGIASLSQPALVLLAGRCGVRIDTCHHQDTRQNHRFFFSPSCFFLLIPSTLGPSPFSTSFSPSGLTAFSICPAHRGAGRWLCASALRWPGSGGDAEFFKFLHGSSAAEATLDGQVLVDGRCRWLFVFQGLFCAQDLFA